MLAMTEFIGVTRLCFIAVYQYFLGAAMVINFGKDFGSIDGRTTYQDFIPFTNKQHSFQLNCAAFFSGQQFNIEAITGNYTVLFSTCFNYCVNCISPP